MRNQRWWRLLVAFALVGVVGILAWAGFTSEWKTIGEVASAMTAAVGVIRAVAAWRPGRPSADLDAVLEAVATVVRQQWEAEEGVRRLTDPWPLTLRWVICARDGVMDYWEVIRGVEGCNTPIALDGRLDEIGDVFERIPSRRLVVLGEPGSGKSVLAMHFTLTRTRSRVPGDPVPVLFPVASWNPSESSLSAWMVSRLCVDYPILGGRTTAGSTVAADLIERGAIWPVLDGLDEAPEPVRAEVITAVNKTLSVGDRLLLTCRSQQFADAVADAGDVVTGAAVIELAPLRFEDAAGYLRVTTPTRRGVNKWDPVLIRLRAHPQDPLRAVLTTPLMIELARIAYSEHAADPAVMLDRARFASMEDIEDHLLDQLVPSVFSDGAAVRVHDCGWQPGQPQRWLRFLAADLTRRGARDLAWWELYRSLPSTWFRLVSGIAVGLVACGGTTLLTWLLYPYSRISVLSPARLPESVFLGVWVGFLAGYLAGFAPRPSDPAPSRMREQLLCFIGVVSYGVLAAIAAGLLTWWSHPVPGACHSAVPGACHSATMDAVGTQVRTALWLFFAFGVVAGFFGPHPGWMGGGRRDRAKRVLAIAVSVGLTFGFVVLGVEQGVTDFLAGCHGFGHAVRSGLLVGLKFCLAVGVATGIAIAVAHRVPRPAADGPPGPFDPSVLDRLRALLAVALVLIVLIAVATALKILLERQIGIASIVHALQVGLGWGLGDAVPVVVWIGLLPSRSGPVTLKFRLRGRVSSFLTTSLVTGSVIGLATGLSRAVGADLDSRIWVGCVTGLVVGPAVGVVAVCLDTPSVFDRPSSPASSLLADRRSAVVSGLAYAIAAGVNAWPIFDGTPETLGTITTVPVFGFAFFLAAVFSTASGRHVIAALWLWLRGDLPLRTTRFLDDAHDRGAMRRIGGVYQFQHAHLQDRLASQAGTVTAPEAISA
jgi:hypothetical protein